MKIFNSTSIYDCIYPIYNVSKIFGLAPITQPRESKNRKTSIYDYLIFVICESACLFILYQCLTNNYLGKQSDSMIFNIGGIIALLTALIIAIISIYMAMLHRHKMIQILNIINECDEKVMNLIQSIIFFYFNQ